MTLSETIKALSKELLQLQPGALAELRRMDPDGPGAPDYWRLATACGFLHDTRTDAWMRIVKVLAILTPKGERHLADRLHNDRHGFGAALCDGGNPSWGSSGGAHPVLSETRLARFLALPPSQRGPALERLSRQLVRCRDRGHGFNCREIAELLLNPENRSIQRDIAAAYYKRLDDSTRTPEETENA